MTRVETHDEGIFQVNNLQLIFDKKVEEISIKVTKKKKKRIRIPRVEWNRHNRCTGQEREK